MDNMFTPIVSRLTPYELTEDDALAGSILSDTQAAVIQNELVIAAEAKLNLEPKSDDFVNYIQLEAYLRGKMDALEGILSKSEDAKDQLTNNQTSEV